MRRILVHVLLLAVVCVTTPGDLFAAGGNTCGTAASLSSAPIGPIPCNGNFFVDEPIGMTTASPSGGPSGSCWTVSDPAQNDRWYSWTNSSATPMFFVASTDDFVNLGGDSQIAIYKDCSGANEIACDEDGGAILFLSTTPQVAVAPGDTIVIQIDGFQGDASFDRALFSCVPMPPPVAGDNCTNPIVLGNLSPDVTGPVVDRNGEVAPAGLSDYDKVDPTTFRPLDQPETCYTFVADADGWVQIAARPVDNASRVIFSDDGGASFIASQQCWINPNSPPPLPYDTAAQYGARVAAGQSYCYCIDAHDAPVVEAGIRWDLEMHYWPLTTETNVDCANAEPVELCERAVRLTGLSTAGAGKDVGVLPDQGCSLDRWTRCAGFGADLHYQLSWTQEIADCGCSGFQVTQTAPNLGTDAKLCDAALQVATSCPPNLLSCLATVDNAGPGGDEVATVSGLGPANVGDTFYVQADHFMTAACPNFDVIFELTGCSVPCAVPICASAGCDVIGVDVTLMPTTPARTGAWVFSASCSPDARLDSSLPTGSVRLPGANSGDTFGSAAPGSVGLTLYQIDCSCPNDIFIVKEAIASTLRVEFR